MFKKDFNISNISIMSNKERKEFIVSKLKIKYDCSIIEDYLCSKKWSSAKFSGSKKKIILYNEEPIFFEYDKDIFFPTVYLLNMIPHFVKNTCIIFPDTDSFLDNGADLMWKGILNKDIIQNTSFQLSTLFKVTTIDGITTSIGVSSTSSSLISTLGEKGKFLIIVHRINDQLWQYGSRVIPIQIQNVVKEEQKVEEKESTEIKIEEVAIEHKAELTKQEYDDNLLKVFYTIIKHSTTLKDELPIDPGKLLQYYIKPTAEELKLEVNLKLSSYKGMNNFLKTIAKEHKTIVFSSKKNNEDRLTTIISDQLEHKILIDNYAYKTLKRPLACDKEEIVIKEKDNVILDNNEIIEIKQYYKPQNLFSGYFSKIHQEHKKGDCYELKEINDIVLNYLRSKQMIDKDKVILDQEVINSLRVRPISKDNEDKKYPIFIIIPELLSYIKDNLIEKDEVVKMNKDDNSTIILSNNQLKIKVTAKKLNNKNVTIVEGLESFLELKEACQIFAKTFACSVSIKNPLGVQGGAESILIQGYWVYELSDILEKELKVQKKFITIEDKLKLKKKN